jgi:hypothetical protein
MASQVYNEFKRASAAAEIDLDAGGDDIRAALLMNTTTCDTDNDGVLDLLDFGTLARSDATGYADVQLTSEAVNKDDANDRAEFDATDISFTGLGGDAANDYQGVLIYKFVTGDSDSIPIAWIEFPAEITLTATQVDVSWNSEGILQFS